MWRQVFYIIIFLIFIATPAYSKPKIFILSSYDKMDVCGGQQYKGVVDVLRLNLLNNFTLKSFWIDSRHLDKKQLNLRIKKAVSSIKAFSCDVLITIDDVAFKVALDHFLGKAKPIIVFSGVNKPLNLYNQKYHFLKDNIPTKNVTGVYEYIFAKEGIQFLDSWIEDENYKIAAIYSNDKVSLILRKQLYQELGNSPYKNRIIDFKITSLEELKSTIKKIKANPNIKAYFPFTLKVWDEKSKRYFSFTELIPFLKTQMSIPAIFPNTRVAYLGLLGGLGSDFYKMGRQAGKIALATINGTPLRYLPVQYTKNYEIVINSQRAKECKLPIHYTILYSADEVVNKP